MKRIILIIVVLFAIETAFAKTSRSSTYLGEDGKLYILSDWEAGRYDIRESGHDDSNGLPTYTVGRR